MYPALDIAPFSRDRPTLSRKRPGVVTQRDQFQLPPIRNGRATPGTLNPQRIYTLLLIVPESGSSCLHIGGSGILVWALFADVLMSRQGLPLPPPTPPTFPHRLQTPSVKSYEYRLGQFALIHHLQSFISHL